MNDRRETWLSKPAAESYVDFLARMESNVTEHGCLWQRQMTLGPTPEFSPAEPGSATRPVGRGTPFG